ncbi:MAG: cupin domain-containing protein [Litoreibacter sp.]
MAFVNYRNQPVKTASGLLHSIVLLSAVGLALPATAGSDDTDGTTRTTHNEVEWNEFPGGRAIANVVGDFKTGAHLKFVRFDAGVKTPPHVHSHSYVGIVVKGRARHFEPGKQQTETILEPGSTWSINAGVPHISECLEGSECLFATQSGGAFDSAPAD